MIRSWADKKTKAFFETGRAPKGTGWASLDRVVARKVLLWLQPNGLMICGLRRVIGSKR